MPARSRSVRSKPSSPTPRAASPTHTRSRARRDITTASSERPGELDRHRQAQRDPCERLVDRPVHGAQADPERDHGQPVVAAAAAQRGPRDRDQHDRAGDQSQPHHRGRLDGVEQVLGHRRAELHRGDPREHQPDRGDRPPGHEGLFNRPPVPPQGGRLRPGTVWSVFAPSDRRPSQLARAQGRRGMVHQEGGCQQGDATAPGTQDENLGGRSGRSVSDADTSRVRAMNLVSVAGSTMQDTSSAGGGPSG